LGDRGRGRFDVFHSLERSVKQRSRIVQAEIAALLRIAIEVVCRRYRCAAAGAILSLNRDRFSLFTGRRL
jgi:hypothetical protein